MNSTSFSSFIDYLCNLRSPVGLRYFLLVSLVRPREYCHSNKDSTSLQFLEILRLLFEIAYTVLLSSCKGNPALLKKNSVILPLCCWAQYYCVWLQVDGLLRDCKVLKFCGCKKKPKASPLNHCTWQFFWGVFAYMLSFSPNVALCIMANLYHCSKDFLPKSRGLVRWGLAVLPYSF